MRFSFFSLFFESPFKKLKDHADKVRECAWMFKRAVECYVEQDCEEFDKLTEDVAKLESQADWLKRNLRNHLPRGLLMPVDKFVLVDCLREQDHVLDNVEAALYWLSFKPEGGIVEELVGDFLHLVDAVIPCIEKLPDMAEQAMVYLKNSTEKNRDKLKIIGNIADDAQNASDRMRTMIAR